jgi:hypothetical protein
MSTKTIHKNGGSKESRTENKNTGNNNAASRNHSEEQEGLTYEQKLAEVLAKKKQNNKKFFSWKDRKQAYLHFTDPDHGDPHEEDSTIAPKNPDGTFKKRWVVDQKVREIKIPGGEEGPELTWRMPITAAEAFEHFRKRGIYRLDVEKTGEDAQTRYLFFQMDTTPNTNDRG